jgi:hypothetical protein
VTSADAREGPLDAFKLALLDFARMTSCADCLRWCEGLPFNLLRGKFQARRPDLEPTSPRRHAAWWLLAFLSGQFDPRARRTACQTIRCGDARLGTEGDWGDEHLSMLIHTELGGSLAPDALVTMADPNTGRGSRERLAMPALARQAWSRRTDCGPSGTPGAESSP